MVASLCHHHLVTVIFTFSCKSISTVIERGVSMCYIVRHSFMMPKFVGRHSTARDGVCFMENFCNTKKSRCPVFSRTPRDRRASLAKPLRELNKDFLANILPTSQHAPRVYDDCAEKFHHDVIWAYPRPSPWNSNYEDSCLLGLAEVSLSFTENSR